MNTQPPEIQPAESVYKMLIEQAVDSITLIDRDGVVRYQNPASEANFGWRPSELLGTSIFDLVHPDDQAEALAAYAVVVSGGEQGRITVRFKHRRGDWRFAEVLATATDDGMVLNTREVTDAHHYIEKTRLSEELFSKAFNATSTVYAIYSLDSGQLINVNDAWERVFGFSRDESIGSDGRAIGIWRSNDERNDYFQQLESQGALVQYPVTLKNKNGNEVHLLIDGTVTWIQGDRCLFIAGLDITERRQIEDQLRQSQRMEAVGQLTGGIAHDFNNMLTIIMGNVALASSPTLTNARLQEILEKIRSAAEHGAETIQQLMTFSRKQELKTEPSVVSDVILGLKSLLQTSLGSPIKLELQLLGPDSRSDIDKSLLRNALLNLVINARDAMPNGGDLMVKLDVQQVDEQRAATFEVSPGSFVQISVMDTGCGMQRETCSMAFEPFFTTKESGHGTGLGLSMVFGFVRASGGFVELDSVPERGTTVSLFLPRIVDHSENV